VTPVGCPWSGSPMWDVDVEETTTLLSLHVYLLSLCTDGSVL
jgi:hypothetical protein